MLLFANMGPAPRRWVDDLADEVRRILAGGPRPRATVLARMRAKWDRIDDVIFIDAALRHARVVEVSTPTGVVWTLPPTHEQSRDDAPRSPNDARRDPGDASVTSPDTGRDASETAEIGDPVEAAIRSMLEHGPAPAAAVIRGVCEALGVSRRTVQRRRKRMGLVVERRGGGASAPTPWWSLPRVAPQRRGQPDAPREGAGR